MAVRRVAIRTLKLLFWGLLLQGIVLYIYIREISLYVFFFVLMMMMMMNHASLSVRKHFFIKVVVTIQSVYVLGKITYKSLDIYYLSCRFI